MFLLTMCGDPQNNDAILHDQSIDRSINQSINQSIKAHYSDTCRKRIRGAR